MSSTDKNSKLYGSLLIVEDDEELLKLIMDFASRDGLSVYGATNCADAMALLRRHHFDGVLSDINLPGQSGLELFDLAQLSGIQTPFAFITGSVQVGNIVKAVRLGAVDFIEKPFTKEDFLLRARNLLSVGLMRRDLSDLLEDLARVAPNSREVIEQLTQKTALARLTNARRVA